MKPRWPVAAWVTITVKQRRWGSTSALCRCTSVWPRPLVVDALYRTLAASYPRAMRPLAKAGSPYFGRVRRLSAVCRMRFSSRVVVRSSDVVRVGLRRVVQRHLRRKRLGGGGSRELDNGHVVTAEYGDLGREAASVLFEQAHELLEVLVSSCEIDHRGLVQRKTGSCRAPGRSAACR